MASKPPDSVAQDNLGSLRLVRASYVATNIDDTDTWDTKIKGIVDAWFGPSTTSGVVGVAISGTTLTFAASAANQVGTLYILARS